MGILKWFNFGSQNSQVVKEIGKVLILVKNLMLSSCLNRMLSLTIFNNHDFLYVCLLQKIVSANPKSNGYATEASFETKVKFICFYNFQLFFNKN